MPLHQLSDGIVIDTIPNTLSFILELLCAHTTNHACAFAIQGI
jgi:hypothetical protein